MALISSYEYKCVSLKQAQLKNRDYGFLNLFSGLEIPAGLMSMTVISFSEPRRIGGPQVPVPEDVYRCILPIL